MKYPTFAAAALLSCAFAACAAIPEVSFEDDAGADATAAAERDGGGLDVDASSEPDGSTGTPPVDAGADAAACPRTPPPGATTCCGPIPCVGGKCTQRCAECARCGGDAGDGGRFGSVCCVPNSGGQQATCVDAPQRCPNNGGNGGNGG
jgi:hypothetical protein